MPSGAASAQIDGQVVGAALGQQLAGSAAASRRWPASGRARSPAGRPASPAARPCTACGSWVCSSRASPTKPICDSGSRLNAASAMPSPARSTGTSSGGLAIATPVVGATGVVIGTLGVGQVAGGLVDQQRRQLAQRGAELGVAAALVAHHGQPGLDDGVVDDGGLHGSHPTGPAWPGPLATLLDWPVTVARIAATAARRDRATTRRCAGSCTACPASTRSAPRAAPPALATRSIKTTAKAWAIDTAISMVDLTTLEGADTPGKVRSLCAKAMPARPDRPARARRSPPSASTPTWSRPRSTRCAASAVAGRQRRHRLPVRAGGAGDQAARRARRGRRRRRPRSTW